MVLGVKDLEKAAAEHVERLLGVPATARNWRTVSTVLEMARQA